MGNREVFDQLVVASATELFRHRGIELEPTTVRDAPIEYAAVIGFAADDMRGMVGLGMDPDTLRNLAAHVGAAGVNPEDWLGESANQLLGRLKNKLLDYGVAVGVALPTVLRGVRLEFLATAARPLWTYGFQSDAGWMCAWLDVRLPAEFVLTRTDDPELRGTPEGELLLF
jgi:hypothetical protein